jgi:hypothetical protein
LPVPQNKEDENKRLSKLIELNDLLTNLYVSLKSVFLNPSFSRSAATKQAVLLPQIEYYI